MLDKESELSRGQFSPTEERYYRYIGDFSSILDEFLPEERPRFTREERDNLGVIRCAVETGLIGDDIYPDPNRTTISTSLDEHFPPEPIIEGFEIYEQPRRVT